MSGNLDLYGSNWNFWTAAPKELITFDSLCISFRINNQVIVYAITVKYYSHSWRIQLITVDVSAHVSTLCTDFLTESLQRSKKQSLSFLWWVKQKEQKASSMRSVDYCDHLVEDTSNDHKRYSRITVALVAPISTRTDATPIFSGLLRGARYAKTQMVSNCGTKTRNQRQWLKREVT